VASVDASCANEFAAPACITATTIDACKKRRPLKSAAGRDLTGIITLNERGSGGPVDIRGVAGARTEGNWGATSNH
jgi:hypothetical protein